MRSLPLVSSDHQVHVPFERIAPYLRAALLLGSGGGFLLASILTLTPLFGVPLGAWWLAVVQTHGHLQLFGWAGLFVIGVALYFLPRLRGKPLAWPALLPWIGGMLVSSLLLRLLSQPLLVVTGWFLWALVLIVSGVLEALVLPVILLVLAQTSRRGPAGGPAGKNAVEGLGPIAPLIFGAFFLLALDGILNLFNCITLLANGGLVPAAGDQANIMLGLFGLLVPMALGMSTRMLPLYARIQPFPAPLLRVLTLVYFAGIICWLLGLFLPGPLFASISGLGNLLIGIVMLVFTGYFLYLMRRRTQLSPQMAAHAHDAETFAARALQRRREEQERYGPYVGLIGSAYLWGTFGALLLVIDGIAVLLFGKLPVAVDVIRHSFAVGFITLLICGIGTRLVPSFSGRAIRSPKLVTAILVLGNLAVLLRVVSLLLTPVLPGASFFFALSGPTGLALILCFTVNLWPALKTKSAKQAWRT
jgi:uncharacterized protein involved in response to NO